MATQPNSRVLLNLAITIAFVVLFWIPLPIPLLVKPSLLVVAAVIVAHRLQVSSWPLVVFLALLPFALGTMKLALTTPDFDLGTTPQMRPSLAESATIALMLAPATLIGPTAAAAITHLLMSKARSNTSLERMRDR